MKSLKPIHSFLLFHETYCMSHSSAGSSGGSSFSSVFETSRDLAGVFAGVGAALNGFPGTDSPTKNGSYL